MSKPQQTIFIVITRSFMTRNILRSGVLGLLKEAGYKIVIFFPGKEVPQHLRGEFESPTVRLHTVAARPMGPFYRRFNRLKRYLINTRTTRQAILFEAKPTTYTAQEGIVSARSQSSFLVSVRVLFLRMLSVIPGLKKIFRVLEYRLFPQVQQSVEDFFETYKPQAVLSSSITAPFDHMFLKAARRRRIKTLSMPKGWDNVTKEYYPFVPDIFLSPNDITTELACTVQSMDRDHIKTVGLPQFDWYRKAGVLRTREEHFKRLGLDPERALIFFGSEGSWAQNDTLLASTLHQWIEEGALARPAQLLVRPHYSNAHLNPFDFMQGKSHVVVDRFRAVDFLVDKWDPSTEETIDFINSVYHCDVLVNVASTLSLDAAACDRPAVMVAFGCEYVDGRDVTEEKLYSADHLQWLQRTGGVAKAFSLHELKTSIDAYLQNPALHKEGRERIREDLCFKVDGKSSARIVEAIIK